MNPKRSSRAIFRGRRATCDAADLRLIDKNHRLTGEDALLELRITVARSRFIATGTPDTVAELARLVNLRSPAAIGVLEALMHTEAR